MSTFHIMNCGLKSFERWDPRGVAACSLIWLTGGTEDGSIWSSGCELRLSPLRLDGISIGHRGHGHYHTDEHDMFSPCRHVSESHLKAFVPNPTPGGGGADYVLQETGIPVLISGGGGGGVLGALFGGEDLTALVAELEDVEGQVREEHFCVGWGFSVT